MPTTKRRATRLHHDALRSYTIARELLRLVDVRRIDPAVIEAELDGIGERLAGELGCDAEDLLERKEK